jgi:glycosyltransferase involved in cell wall biosynthesis
MRILAIYRHYVPDTAPYARILRTIVEHWAATGNEVTVFTAQPSYNDVRQPCQPWRQTSGGVEVRRVRLLPERKRWRTARALNFAWFLLRAIAHVVFAKKYDLVVTNSHPPVLMGCALRVIHAWRGTPFIYHCQDLHPEAAVVGGDLTKGRLYQRLLRWDTAACLAARRVVVLSKDMADTLLARGVPHERISIINNPPLAIYCAERPTLPSPLGECTDTVRFLFAGNLGRFQALERLLAAAKLAAGRVPVQLIFMGEGSAKPELVELARELLGRRIVFVPHQPVETALAAMRACDYGVVSLRPDMYRFAYPSKSMMYWSAGRPVIALIEPESELAQTVQLHGLGYVAAARSVSGIAETLIKAVVERRHWTAERRLHIEQVCRDLFGECRMLARWDELVQTSVSGAHPCSPSDEALWRAA